MNFYEPPEIDDACQDCDHWVDGTCDYDFNADICSEDSWEFGGSEDYLIDGVGFADPGGISALRAATSENPRNLPCPTCGAPDRLTPLDRARGYQCDACADQAERGW
jgi:hypothetical protein